MASITTTSGPSTACSDWMYIGESVNADGLHSYAKMGWPATIGVLCDTEPRGGDMFYLVRAIEIPDDDHEIVYDGEIIQAKSASEAKLKACLRWEINSLDNLHVFVQQLNEV